MYYWVKAVKRGEGGVQLPTYIWFDTLFLSYLKKLFNKIFFFKSTFFLEQNKALNVLMKFGKTLLKINLINSGI
jgi:hypothetical protein